MKIKMKFGKSSLRVLFLMSACFATSCGRVQTAEAQDPPLRADNLTVSKVVVSYEQTQKMVFVNNASFYREGWDTLSHPLFWKRIISLSPDSCIINLASCRRPLETAPYKQWITQTETEKTYFKRYVCNTCGLDSNSTLYVTAGKGEFYEHRKTIPSIAKAVKAFIDYGVDPWYAQTILLIESPGKVSQKSSAGALGPFQLMRSVAIKYGLRVNKKVDERTDMNRSAYAASKLISTICIPKVKEMLNVRNIAYSETDTWFRLLVLHAYHAGAGNLNCAVSALNPTVGGKQLILDLWKTECRGFKNESQNYSQIALASVFTFEDILKKDKDTVFLVQGDRTCDLYNIKKLKGADATSKLTECIHQYENDLIDGTIPVEYFMKRITQLRNALIALNKRSNPVIADSVLFPDDANHYIRLSTVLLRKRKVDDAVKILKFNVDNYPESAMAADSLSKAYKLNGNFTLANKFASRSAALAK